MSKEKGFLLIGKITGFWGLSGHVKVHSFMEIPQELFSFPCYGQESQDCPPYQWDSVAVLTPPNIFKARLEGITTRTQAEGVGKISLYTPFQEIKTRQAAQNRLDEDTFYYAELVGMQVVCSQGSVLGSVTAVHNFGAGDILELMDTQGNHWTMVPFGKPAVLDILRHERTVVVAEDLLAAQVPVPALPGKKNRHG